MGSSALILLLVPDAGTARRVRRLIAERGARTGVVVGTWPELVEWARRSYLLPAPADDWDAVFAAALGELKDAFWAESFKVAPVETAGAVGSALVAVLSATEPGSDLATLKLEGLAERPRRHVADLVRLAQALAGRLPPELAAIRELLAADPGAGLRPVQVISVEGVPALTRWRRRSATLNPGVWLKPDPRISFAIQLSFAPSRSPGSSASDWLEVTLKEPSRWTSTCRPPASVTSTS